MREARAGPMPGSFSSSSRGARFMETSFDSSCAIESRVICALASSAGRGSLTQAEFTAAATQHRMIQPKVFRKRIRSTCESRSVRRVCDICRERVQNARSLKISGTCNVKKRDIHRVFHRSCGKVVNSLPWSHLPANCSFADRLLNVFTSFTKRPFAHHLLNTITLRSLWNAFWSTFGCV